MANTELYQHLYRLSVIFKDVWYKLVCVILLETWQVTIDFNPDVANYFLYRSKDRQFIENVNWCKYFTLIMTLK